MMISREVALSFAREWVEAWNAHDLDRILAHYTDDFTIRSPAASKHVPPSGGIVTGKENVRKYWESSLERMPDLRFEIIDVLQGVGEITIYYLHAAINRKASECMRLDDDLRVFEASVQYSVL